MRNAGADRHTRIHRLGKKFNMYVVDEAADGRLPGSFTGSISPIWCSLTLKCPLWTALNLSAKSVTPGGPTEIIILSCLDDFSLAREAIRLGVSGYILKLTMTTEEMEEVLENACQTLDKVTKTKGSSVAPVNLYDVLEHSLLSHLTYNVPSLSECLVHPEGIFCHHPSP